MVKTKELTLEASTLETTEAVLFYKNAYQQMESDNPYYSIELLRSHLDHQELFCFYFYIEGKIEVMMPFNFRQIVLKGEDTGFKDVSSPWGYNGPLFRKEYSKEIAEAFWKAVDAWYLENKVVSEFLRFNFEKNYVDYTGKALHTLKNVRGNITDWDGFWSGLKSNTRNQFRKAEKEGLTFELHTKDIPKEKIEHFYKLYIGTMDRREAVDSHYHKLEYFLNFCSENVDKMAIGLVYNAGTPISCELFLLSNDTFFSFLGGTDANHFKLRPNEYLKISAIKWFNEQGLTYYMIGGGQADGDNLYLYKKKYFPNDEDINFYTGRKIVDTVKYKELVEKFNPSVEIPEIEIGYFPLYRQP